MIFLLCFLSLCAFRWPPNGSGMSPCGLLILNWWVMPWWGFYWVTYVESLVPVKSLPPCISHQGLIYFSSGKNIKLSLRERDRERRGEEKIAILGLQTLTTREFVTPQVRTSSCRSEREGESQVAISVMLFVIVFKDWFANFVLAASSRLDHDWCYLVTLACSWFASNKLRIVLTFLSTKKDLAMI